MWYYVKAFESSGNDLMHMCGLMVTLNRIEGPHSDWTLGRLVDWKYGVWNPAKLHESFFARHCRLWYDRLGTLAGFALSENGNGDFCMFTREPYRFLYADMIAWAEQQHAPGHTALTMTVPEEDAERRAALEHAGFSSAVHCETTAWYRIEDFQLAATALPPGFVLLSMAEYGDYDQQRSLKNAAFQGGRPMDEARLFAFSHVRESPLYDPAMDIVLVNDSNVAVAGCEGFIDYENGVMEVERVCTAPEYRRRGFASAVIRECVRRGAARGIKAAQISGLNEQTIRLYTSFGRHEAIRHLQYRNSTGHPIVS
jgi:ribosomal protein S18 acetylase RimI-like enzyme